MLEVAEALDQQRFGSCSAHRMSPLFWYWMSCPLMALIASETCLWVDVPDIVLCAKSAGVLVNELCGFKGLGL